MRYQIKRINLYLTSLFILLIIFNIFSFNIIYSQQQQQEQEQENNDPSDTIVNYISDKSVITMLISTFIIAIIGTLITKMRHLKKKLDMIEILTKSQVKMKQQATEKDKVFEERFIQSQKLVSEQIDKLCEKMDRKSEELEEKIDNVERTATATLIKYLSENSFDRKR